MAANRIEQTKEEAPKAKEGNGAGAPAAKGGNPWIPLIANIILMPAIAYGLTTFVLLPKLQGGGGKTATEEHGKEEGEHGGGHGGGGGHGASGAGKSSHAKNRVTVPLGGKVLVNVAGTAGTRYLVASMTLVGKSAEFKDNVEHNDPQLRDAAASILGSKTLGDVDKPGMRNIIRAELISAFNDILGKEAVADIYLTEFAIQ
jgi:flagellar protein FliL